MPHLCRACDAAQKAAERKQPETFHGVEEEREVVLGARVESTLEVALESSLALDGLHDASSLFRLELTLGSHPQPLRVALRQHPPIVLLYQHHLQTATAVNTHKWEEPRRKVPLVIYSPLFTGK